MNVQCHDIEHLIDDYLDGCLNKHDKGKVKKHLKTCEACQTLIQQEKAIVDEIASLPQMTCPDQVVQRIKAQTIEHGNSEKRVTFPLRFRTPWQYVSVGLAATAIVLFFIIQPLFDIKDMEPTSYSQQDVERAQNQAKWSLAYLGKVMNHTEKKVVENVLLKEIPTTLRKSIKNAMPLLQGGQQ